MREESELAETTRKLGGENDFPFTFHLQQGEEGQRGRGVRVVGKEQKRKRSVTVCHAATLQSGLSWPEHSTVSESGIALPYHHQPRVTCHCISFSALYLK